MLIRSFALIIVVSFAIYWFQIKSSPEDLDKYHLLMEESFKERTQKTLAKDPAKQKRVGVQKEIWLENENKRVEILSDSSTLTLTECDDDLEIIEELKNIHCTLPNNLTLQADEGFFTFPSNQFTAIHNCHLKYIENLIDGEEIHVDLTDEVITYKNPKGYLTSGPFHFSSKELIWEKKQNKLYLQSDVKIEQEEGFTLFAEKGNLTLNDLEPQELILEGNVRLISDKIQDKLSFAAADRLIYNPQEKTLYFSSDTKVLFWQDGLTLSAKSVMIRDGQIVEGQGDVHFSFDLEEQNYIDELFKQYL